MVRTGFQGDVGSGALDGVAAGLGVTQSHDFRMRPASPLRIASHFSPAPQAAATAAITFSTWKPIVPLRVIGTSASETSSRRVPSAATMEPPST